MLIGNVVQNIVTGQVIHTFSDSNILKTYKNLISSTSMKDDSNQSVWELKNDKLSDTDVCPVGWGIFYVAYTSSKKFLTYPGF